MHELGIAKDLWALINENAQRNNLKKITNIVIAVGEASGTEIDFLKHSFLDHIFPGSIAQESNLEIIAEKLIAKCKKCQNEITKENINFLRCPVCGSMLVEIISGRETYVKNIQGI